MVYIYTRQSMKVADILKHSSFIPDPKYVEDDEDFDELFRYAYNYMSNKLNEKAPRPSQMHIYPVWGLRSRNQYKTLDDFCKEMCEITSLWDDQEYCEIVVDVDESRFIESDMGIYECALLGTRAPVMTEKFIRKSLDELGIDHSNVSDDDIYEHFDKEICDMEKKIESSEESLLSHWDEVIFDVEDVHDGISQVCFWEIKPEDIVSIRAVRQGAQK